MDDEYLFVRMNATKALRKIANKADVNALVAPLHNEDSNVRIYAAKALGKIRNKSAVNPLIDILDDEYSSVSWDVIEVLE